jgi:signal transduction histidine kinase/CheY-like chemotaxis protein
LVALVQELSLARSFEAVQRVVRQGARELTGADGATFVLREGDHCHYLDEDAIAPLWKGQRFPMSRCVSGWAMEHGRPAVIADIYRDDRVPVDAYRSTFVRSLVMVPIRAAQPIGAIGTYWATPRVASDEEVRMLQALADSTSIALENVKLYTDLANAAAECQRAAEAAQRAEEEARRELAERERAERALSSTEQQLRQAQKMEAIGQLAGGIAHDFNNMLSVILSYGSLALAEARGHDTLQSYLEEIRSAGNRAAGLTHQLLAFSRRQVLERRRIDLNRVVVGVENMLRRMIGENIDFEVRTSEGLHPVLSDEGQLEQVLVNLVLNARDAMPEGGKLTVETANVVLDEEYAARHVGVAPGEYALVAVTDTGHGMDRKTQLRVFEPFFTTKERGKGTGLGLSTAYGIVRQSGGHLWVYSEPGVGTTFKIYLPRTVDERANVAPRPRTPRATTGTEHILLAEDDAQVRSAAVGILEHAGYQVVQAHNAEEALRLVGEGAGRFDLLLTDVVLPQMSGVELARQLRRCLPELKVLCMSGYADDAVLRHGLLDADVAFLSKPLSADTLLSKVRQVLER